MVGDHACHHSGHILRKTPEARLLVLEWQPILLSKTWTKRFRDDVFIRIALSVAQNLRATGGINIMVSALVLESTATAEIGHENVIWASSFRRDRRDSHASRSPKLSVVRVLQRKRRGRHKLWVYDISTMHGHGERDRRILQPEYAIPASARPPLIAATLSNIPLRAVWIENLLRQVIDCPAQTDGLRHQLRQLGDICRDPPRSRPTISRYAAAGS
jgi:hypothetical protein